MRRKWRERRMYARGIATVAGEGRDIGTSATEPLEGACESGILGERERGTAGDRIGEAREFSLRAGKALLNARQPGHALGCPRADGFGGDNEGVHCRAQPCGLRYQLSVRERLAHVERVVRGERWRARGAGKYVDDGFPHHVRGGDTHLCIAPYLRGIAGCNEQSECQARLGIRAGHRQELDGADSAHSVPGDPHGRAWPDGQSLARHNDDFAVTAQRGNQRIEEKEHERDRRQGRDQQQSLERVPLLAWVCIGREIADGPRVAWSTDFFVHVMMRLGHIEYSNCMPVDARLVLEPAPEGVSVVTAIPSRLNAALAAGDIDVAPCSSIELARHDGEYRVLPDLVIGSDGPVHSIILETARSIAELDGADIAVPTASATSVVLLRILLERRYRVRARLVWHDQSDEEDPIAAGAAAVLRIGDVALNRALPPGRQAFDLGMLWTEWTRLPFAFAVWQVRAAVDGTPELARLHRLLVESRSWFDHHSVRIAREQASHFGLPAERLHAYWRSLRYQLDPRMQQGLLHFYALAAELGEVVPVSSLAWAHVGER